MDDFLIVDGEIYMKVEGKGLIKFGENYIKINEDKIEETTKTIDLEKLNVKQTALLEKYTEALGITYDLTKEIIKNNQSAISFLQDEKVTIFGYTKNNLQILIKLTLFKDEVGELNEEDKKVLKNHYNIGDDCFEI